MIRRCSVGSLEIDAAVESKPADPRLFLGGAKSPAEVAAAVGVPVEEVERVLASFWQSVPGHRRTGMSPVSERVQLLAAVWPQFDRVHSRQKTGMPSLWGLLDDRTASGWDGPDWFSPGGYRTLLPPGLVDETERLWGSVMLPRWPGRIVSAHSAAAGMKGALGPAYRFWEGVSLTAWFVCEGPYSRTDIAGLEDYHEKEVAALAALGYPIDPALFPELRRAETRLGSPEPIIVDRSATDVRGIRLETSLSAGTRRPGFEHLRDVITRHRRAWTEAYLDDYLTAMAEAPMKEAAGWYEQTLAEKGKPPTPKQFAKHAQHAVNHWLGGSLEALYTAMGEKSPVRSERRTLMPPDQADFVKRVFKALGGQPVSPFAREAGVSTREEHRAWAEARDRRNKLDWLAGQAIYLVQLHEALGRVPKLKEFGAGGFQYRSETIGPDVEETWVRYVGIVGKAARELGRDDETRRLAHQGESDEQVIVRTTVDAS